MAGTAGVRDGKAVDRGGEAGRGAVVWPRTGGDAAAGDLTTDAAGGGDWIGDDEGVSKIGAEAPGGGV